MEENKKYLAALVGVMFRRVESEKKKKKIE